MKSARPVIAIIDDYEKRVPGLKAFADLREALPDADIRIIDAQPLDDAGVSALRDVEYLVLIRERTRIDEVLLARLPALKALVQTGMAGAPETSHIDQAACAARGIPVLEGRASDGHSAAELTWALILAARRQLPGYIDSFRQGRWHQGNPAPQLARSLRGDVMGILGYGRIGQLLGRYAQAFGMDVLVWGRQGSIDAAREHGVRVAESRDALFAHSDVLAIQMRMNADTRHAITGRELGLMKPSALLVNTARPGLIQPGALEAALRAGRPGMAAIDVHPDEPVLGSAELLSLPNCVATPHIGYVELHSYETLFSAAFTALVEWLRGRTDQTRG